MMLTLSSLLRDVGTVGHLLGVAQAPSPASVAAAAATSVSAADVAAPVAAAATADGRVALVASHVRGAVVRVRHDLVGDGLLL